MSGVTAALDQQQIDTLYGNIIIDPPGNQHYLSNISQVESKLASIWDVSGIAPHLNNQAFFEYNWQSDTSAAEKGSSGEWNVIGINPDQEQNQAE